DVRGLHRACHHPQYAPPRPGARPVRSAGRRLRPVCRLCDRRVSARLRAANKTSGSVFAPDRRDRADAVLSGALLRGRGKYLSFMRLPDMDRSCVAPDFELEALQDRVDAYGPDALDTFFDYIENAAGFQAAIHRVPLKFECVQQTL